MYNILTDSREDFKQAASLNRARQYRLAHSLSGRRSRSPFWAIWGFWGFGGT